MSLKHHRDDYWRSLKIPAEYLDGNVNTVQRSSVAMSSIRYAQRMSGVINIVGRRIIADVLLWYIYGVFIRILYLVIKKEIRYKSTFIRKGQKTTNHPFLHHISPDSKVHGANMGLTWALSAPDGPLVGPMNLAIGELLQLCLWQW